MSLCATTPSMAGRAGNNAKIELTHKEPKPGKVKLE